LNAVAKSTEAQRAVSPGLFSSPIGTKPDRVERVLLCLDDRRNASPMDAGPKTDPRSLRPKRWQGGDTNGGGFSPPFEYITMSEKI
jgi:hypothetical protein